MDIETLAKRKIELQTRLQAIGQCNVYGREVKDLVALEMDGIKTRKELYDVERQIRNYVEQ